MTLEQFRAARRAVDDLADPMLATKTIIDLSEAHSGPGIIYPGDLVIELCPNSDDYCLTIGNGSSTGKLADLEEILYRWAIAEEITEVCGLPRVVFSQVMAQYPNFTAINTGGGCMAMQHPTDDGGYLLVTDTDGPGNLPTDWDRDVIVARYDSEGNCVGGDMNTPTITLDYLKTWIDMQLGGFGDDRKRLHLGMHAIANLLLALTYNRFGKPETYNAHDEREAIRLLAVEYDVGPSQTVLEQAGKVARAIATACGGEQ